MNAFVEVWRNAYVRVLVYLALAAWSLLTLRELRGVVLLAGLAYLFAYLFYPLVVWFRRYRISQPVGVGFAFLIVLIFLGIAALLIGSVISELVQFTEQIPRLANDTELQINHWLAQLEQFKGQNKQLQSVIDQATSALQDALSSIVKNLLSVLQSAGGGLLTRTLGVLGGVVEFFLVLVVGTYMLGSFEAMGKTLLEVFPQRWQPSILDFSKDVSTAVGGYIRGQLLIALTVGLMIGAGLAVLGIPLALALGFLSAVFNIVPYLGVVISIAPALLLASQFGLVKVILVVVLFVVANQIEGHFLSPNILARATDLHPITVILTILVSASLLGIFGGILAVPLVALVKLLIRKHWLTSSLHNDGLPRPAEVPKLEPPTEASNPP